MLICYTGNKKPIHKETWIVSPRRGAILSLLNSTRKKIQSPWHRTVSLPQMKFLQSRKVKVLVTQLCLILCDPTNCSPAHQAPLSMGFSGKNTGVGNYCLLQGIFLTQGSNPGLLNCRQILYHLSHKRSPVQGSTGHQWALNLLRTQKNLNRNIKG